MKHCLSQAEWNLVAALLLLMLGLVIVSKINARRAAVSGDLCLAREEEILVIVEGAVKKPGRYFVHSGAALGEVLRKARPEVDADLTHLSAQKVIDCPLYLKIEPLQEIVVHVKGAIATPVTVVLPPKSRICDLKSKVIFTSETDKSFFRRKKMLRNGEEVEVPKKTVEVNSSDSLCSHTDI